VKGTTTPIRTYVKKSRQNVALFSAGITAAHPHQPAGPERCGPALIFESSLILLQNFCSSELQ